MKLTKDLIQRALDEAYKVLHSVGLLDRMPDIIDIQLTNAISYWAKITTYGNCLHFLSVSRVFEQLDDSRLMHDLTETCIHELIHTRPRCHNHGRYFQSAACRVNAAYKQYRIKTGTSASERNVNLLPPKVRWNVVCKNCGATTAFAKKPKIASYPQNYMCTRCHAEGQFEATRVL